MGEFWSTNTELDPVGIAVVVMARVPEEVIGDPVTVNIEGTVIDTEVTVPAVAGDFHAGAPATQVKTWFAVPDSDTRFFEMSVVTREDAVKEES